MLDPTCYLCGRPIDFLSMQVDHLLPERLLDAPGELEAALAAFALDLEFNLNSFENWMPSCGPCNSRKSGMTFEPMPIVAVQLARAKAKSAEARSTCQKPISSRQTADALAKLLVASGAGDLDVSMLRPLAVAYLEAHPRAKAAIRDKLETKPARISRSHLGFQVMPPPILELPLTPFAKIVYWASAQAELVSIESYRP